ncbi:hydroxyacyl-coenzyme A dehydrogenase, mitochondrial-like [Phlebotomus argentipes]|uniref:hydroxyacyl-coenzyme A dehydrogenase, mitochondrial-like n=1 Tax=Phlebotomus argentipes TaxID=94469 RepID=UPI0028930465|nr:hydroxyacyl-coenzyme A dehydrogenase, mitochondrial-like [Phlebotomus argentipes]
MYLINFSLTVSAAHSKFPLSVTDWNILVLFSSTFPECQLCVLTGGALQIDFRPAFWRREAVQRIRTTRTQKIQPHSGALALFSVRFRNCCPDLLVGAEVALSVGGKVDIMSQLMRVITRKMSTSRAVEKVVVIGGGLMGAGIAQVAASSGFRVTLVEVNEQLVEKAKGNIQKSLARVAKKQFKDDEAAQNGFVATTLGRLDATCSLTDAVRDTDLVIEAIVENMKVKHDLFAKIDSVAPQHAIFASNTSSLSIREIAQVTQRRDRFGGLHFFNPVPVMKLLEVIRTPETSDDTYKRMMDFGQSMGKVCITCKDTPGFVVNRLLVPYLAEAVRLLERGDATAKDIDIAMKLGAGYPMGPLELADYVGLDTTRNIISGWHENFPENPLFQPIGTLEKLVQDGKLGVKSGEGFYSYKK